MSDIKFVQTSSNFAQFSKSWKNKKAKLGQLSCFQKVWTILLSPIFHFDRGNNGRICHILCVKLLGNKFFILEAALLVFGLCHVFLKVAYFKRLHSYCWWTKIACKSRNSFRTEKGCVLIIQQNLRKFEFHYWNSNFCKFSKNITAFWRSLVFFPI